MKLTLFLYSFFILFLANISQLHAQVGINTEDPQAMLDIVGDLRITDVKTDNTLTDLLVIGSDNKIYKNTNNPQILSPLKSFVKATGGSSISLLDISLLSGWNKIEFDQVEFDENNEYDTSTFEFTCSQDGIYDVYARIKASSLLGAGDLGIGIFIKRAGDTAFSLVADETYLSISVLSINVSPPTRNVKTLVKLNAGDIIAIGAKVPTLSLSLIGGSSSYFTISQVN